MQVTIIEERLAEFTSGERRLKSGAHSANSGEYCLLEAANYVTGAPVHTDHPASVSGAIGEFGRMANDRMTGQERTEWLLPLLPQLPGARNGPETEERITWLFVDWAVRVYLPTIAELVDAPEQTERLRVLPAIADRATAKTAVPTIIKVTEALRSRDRDRDLARALDRARALALALALDRARALARALALDLALDRALALALDLALDLDRAESYRRQWCWATREVLEEAIALARAASTEGASVP